MKVLLDENIPHNLRTLLGSAHDVFTVAFMGWRAIQNGDLLHQAKSSGFDVLVTTDSKMEFEQNRSSLPIAIVILRARSNAIEDLRPLVPALLEALATSKTKSLTCIGP